MFLADNCPILTAKRRHSNEERLDARQEKALSQFTCSQYNAAMQVISLQSGSNGNCIYVEAAGVRLLFDAGLSGVQVQDPRTSRSLARPAGGTAPQAAGPVG